MLVTTRGARARSRDAYETHKQLWVQATPMLPRLTRSWAGASRCRSPARPGPRAASCAHAGRRAVNKRCQRAAPEPVSWLWLAAPCARPGNRPARRLRIPRLARGSAGCVPGAADALRGPAGGRWPGRFPERPGRGETPEPARQILRSRMERTEWSLSLRSTSLARERVGSTFSRRFGPLIVAQMCRARSRASGSDISA